MIQDLHSHTYYSFCGKDRPEEIVEAAIAGGIEVFGISDHNYGIGFQRMDLFNEPSSANHMGSAERTLRRYYDHINLIKEKYADKIDVKRGIEVNTLDDGKGFTHHRLPDVADISYFDYCIIENLDCDISCTNGDLFSYRKRLGCPLVGIAHTDMFGFLQRKGEDPLEYFKHMADENIFWEMNVSYDSIHGYRQHQYMLNFFDNPEQQEIVRKSGVLISIGFDGHKVEDYLPERVTDYNNRLTDMGIKKPYEV